MHAPVHLLAAAAGAPSATARERRLALAAALLLFAALALFGARYHWVEEAGTAERDGYVAQAEELLAGRLPRDAFRPLLYPLAIAGLSRASGLEPFAAARFLSNLAAAALAWIAWAMGRRLGGARSGAFAMALTAVNPNLWRIGQHVTTDMPFAALAAAALLAGLAYRERPRAATAAAAGLAWGLAAFTRGNAIFLLPPLLVAWWLAGRRRGEDGKSPAGARRAMVHLGAAAAAALAALVPHWTLRAAAFGDPFHDENWKNLAWKLYGYPDWSYLERVPFAGALELLRADPGAVLRGGAAELGRFALEGLPQLFGTWAHVGLLAAGAVVALKRPEIRRRALWLLAAGGLFLVATATAFFTWGRLLLVLLPIGNAVACAPWWRDSQRGAMGLAREAADERAPQWRTRAAGALVTVVLAALVALLALKTFAFRLPVFVANHPYTEVAVLRRLDARLPAGASLAGTSPFLDRYLTHPYLAIPDAFGPDVAQPALYLDRLHDLLAASGAAYLVVGEVDLRDRPRSLLGPSPPAPWLAPAGVALRRAAPGRLVAVWRVRPAAPDRPLERTPAG